MGLLDNGLNTISNLVKENPLASLGGAALAGAGIAVGVTTLVTSLRNNKSSRKTGKRIKHTRRGWKQDRKRRSRQKWEVAYQRRKRKRARKHVKHSRSRRGVHYTKNGQPYKILANGRARFIKKRR